VCSSDLVGVSIPLARRGSGGELTAGAIPYHTWANRVVGAMRVWIPRA